MSYIWFNSVLEASGKILNYESVSNLYGRTSFDKKGAQEIQKIITESNPLHKKGTGNSAATFLSMPGNMVIVDSKQKDAVKSALGDISWFEDFMK